MKNGKKLCLFLLCTLLVALLIPGLAGAADSDFEITDGVLTKYTGPGGDVVIPEGVTSIGDAAFGLCYDLTSVKIPKGVTQIGKGVFMECLSLTSVEIPEGVTSIGNMAFDSCPSLTSVTLPSTLEFLGSDVFEGCSGLTSMEDKSGKFLKTVGSVVYRADGTEILAVLASASGEIHIAEGVTEIPRSLFSNKSLVTGIVIPEGVTTIGNYAFNQCESLISVTLPSTLETLGRNVFEGCSHLTSIDDKSGRFLKTVDDIVYSADGTQIVIVLASASGEIRIAEGVTGIPYGLFRNNSRITGIIVPEGVTKIEDDAFSYCENLLSVTLPSTLETLGEGVFANCSNLTSIEDKSGKFLKTVDGIVYSADGTKIIAVLANASGKLQIAEGVAEIPYGLFNNNDRITGIVVPEGVTSIGNYAFINCENLISVTLPSTLESLGENVFDGCSKLTNIEDKSGKFLKVVDGIVYSADGTKITAVLESASGEIHIAEGVTEIPAWSFFNSRRITSIVIPEGVTSIGNWAFNNCKSLVSVTLPSTLEALGESVFEGCDNLTSIVDKSGKFLKTADGIVYSVDGTKIIAILASASGDIHIAEGVTEIPALLFSGNSRVTSVVIPEGVIRIGDQAFYWCENLTSVTLPSTLRILGESVFDGCHQLSDITDKSGQCLKTINGIVYSADGTQIIAVLTSASGEICIAEGVTEIPSELFYDNSRVTSIVIPEGVTKIGDRAFGWCENLTSITLPSTLQTLGENVFDNCPQLTNIVDRSGKFIKTVDGIVYSADGTQLIAVLTSASGEIHIAEGVTEIPSSLFSTNSRVTSIVVPEGVIEIGYFAFSGCTGLTSVTLPSTLETLRDCAFIECPSLASIEDRSGKFLKVVDGLVYSMDGTQLIAVLASVSGEVHIAEGVTEIPDRLFSKNLRVTSVVVPEGVTSIWFEAFYECTNLTSITLPSTLEMIEEEAIPLSTIIRSEPGVYAHTWALANGYTWQAAQQSGLKVMKLPAGLKTIQQEAFQGSPAECFVLPDGCLVIGERAFADCKELKLVEIPSSVVAIAENAFEGCGEGVVIVTPKGSAAERFARAHGITVTSDEP